MMPSRRSGRSSVELLGVGADARQRRLEVVADAAEEVVLGGVELEQLGVLRLDLGEQLRRCGSRPRPRWRTARAGPGRRAPSGRVAGRRPNSTPSSLAARPQDGPQRARLAGDRLLDRDRAPGRPSRPPRRSSRTPSVASSAARATSESTPSRGDAVLDGREDPAELAVAPLEVRRQPVVALGEAGELVVAGDLDRASTGRPPRPGRPPRANARSGAVRSSTSRYEPMIAEGDHDGQREQQQPRDRRVQRSLDQHEHDQQPDEAEDRQRQDPAREQGQRQPRPEGEPRAASRRGARSARVPRHLRRYELPYGPAATRYLGWARRQRSRRIGSNRPTAHSNFSPALQGASTDGIYRCRARRAGPPHSAARAGSGRTSSVDAPAMQEEFRMAGRIGRVLTSVRPLMRPLMPRARMGVRGSAPYQDCVLRHIEPIWFSRPRLIDRCAIPSFRPLLLRQPHAASWLTPATAGAL